MQRMRGEVELGPTEKQVEMLKDLGKDPKDFKDKTPKEITVVTNPLFNKRRKEESKLRLQRTVAQRMKSEKAKRLELIAHLGLKRGMQVYLKYEESRRRPFVIEKITPAGQLKFKGRKDLFGPSAIRSVLSPS